MAMVAKTVVAAEVGIIRGPIGQGIAGVDLTRGQWIYSDITDDSLLKLASAGNDATTGALKSVVLGMVLRDVKQYQAVEYARPGSVVRPGFSLVEGETYILSDTPGLTALIAESVGQGVIKCILGAGINQEHLQVFIHNSAVVYDA